MIIQSQAPVRIDLAGGTLDIWPLNQLTEQATTINLGINLFAKTTIETSKRQGSKNVVLKSKDQKIESYFSWEQFNTQPKVSPKIKLLFLCLKYFTDKKPELNEYNLSITTHAMSPAGAGLGGSSALCISLLGGLFRLANQNKELNETVKIELIDIAKDLEAKVIQVPTGLQDYFGAAFGGLQSLRWSNPIKRTDLPLDVAVELEQRLLLFYSGKQRNSGINNWALYKNFIDNKKSVRSKFSSLAKITSKLETALISKDWKTVGRLISQEWAVRETLASGISTPEIRKVFKKSEVYGDAAHKVCGAGGGGCFFILLPENDLELRTEFLQVLLQVFKKKTIEPLAFRVSNSGLEVNVKP